MKLATLHKWYILLAFYVPIMASQLIPNGQREIRIIAPSYKMPNINSFNAAVAKLRGDFAKVGYSNFIEKDGALTVWRTFYPATTANRAIDLKNAIFNETNKSVIWALTGGRNSAEVFEFFPIDQNNQINRPIYLFGFSDITAIHYYMSLYYPKIKTIHSMNSEGLLSFLALRTFHSEAQLIPIFPFHFFMILFLFLLIYLNRSRFCKPIS